MTCLLVVDASSTLCSVALCYQGQQWHISEEQPRRQAQRLLPMVDELLKKAQVSKQDLQGIAYGCGPGSFTGIRIAASVTQGIALALDLPALGLSSLQAVAQEVFAQSDAQQVMAIMNAHMGEVFWGAFERDGDLCKAISKEQVGSPEKCLAEIAEFNGEVAGDGLALPDFTHLPQQWAQVQPQAQHILSLAKDAWHKQLFTDAEEQQPVYLRESVAWKKLSEQPSLLSR